ncbi:16S rRNA (cytosine(1402)-N(4))-methyltransferase RsmH [Candidatus Aminicenantes bacterium AC-708-M15]|nr:16S rRNA (cytosine(1402)-N(4))-methyltransferase RsmH [SCandidatus Aminicenantes bacterium Aminicenantia_JdfR_composite]MCP2604044.1 16S rRNA (cytosine(1402)-N(4))-methyltransferase RsmH [Candidatus Aminicenantes bacterium AC-708-M15]MCP2618325.1 16S rRNA (cytosine(1402)-N(4))-methyltransferase RsmH [Candidatus Aminicenantes bacterium AC-335-A11]
MVKEVIDFIEPNREGIILDFTVGTGGHAEAILKSSDLPILIGFDKDEESLGIARERLKAFKERVQLYNMDFKNSLEMDIEFSKVIGVLFDFGLSSFQLNNAGRGFSFNLEGPLDMRMDRKQSLTAYHVVNRYPEKELIRILKEYGEIKSARKLAREIIRIRNKKEIETTFELRQIIEKVIPWRPVRGKTHPAAKVFQAIRIEVNKELENLSSFLEELINKLFSGARVVTISFHSLEDRIVKRVFQKLSKNSKKKPVIKVLTKKPIFPSKEEVEQNFRARSARLRACEKI